MSLTNIVIFREGEAEEVQEREEQGYEGVRLGPPPALKRAEKNGKKPDENDDRDKMVIKTERFWRNDRVNQSNLVSSFPPEAALHSTQF